MPVAVETLGALDAGAVELLLELERRIPESTGERRAAEYLVQRLCDTVWQWAGCSRPRLSRLAEAWRCFLFVTINCR